MITIYIIANNSIRTLQDKNTNSITFFEYLLYVTHCPFVYPAFTIFEDAPQINTGAGIWTQVYLTAKLVLVPQAMWGFQASLWREMDHIPLDFQFPK